MDGKCPKEDYRRAFCKGSISFLLEKLRLTLEINLLEHEFLADKRDGRLDNYAAHREAVMELTNRLSFGIDFDKYYSDLEDWPYSGQIYLWAKEYGVPLTYAIGVLRQKIELAHAIDIQNAEAFWLAYDELSLLSQKFIYDDIRSPWYPDQHRTPHSAKQFVSSIALIEQLKAIHYLYSFVGQDHAFFNHPINRFPLQMPYRE